MIVRNPGTASLAETVPVANESPRLAACPGCANNQVTSFFHLPQVPALCHVLAATRLDAQDVQRGDIDLHFCETCGLVFNAAFDPARVQYGSKLGYENSQHFSPRFRRYLDSTAARLRERYDVPNKTFLEIGSGDGYFLDELSRNGDVRAFAIEPTCESTELNPEDSFRTVPGWDELPHQQDFADLVVCRHVLEHVNNPRAFLARVQVALRAGGSVYFEVPRSEYLFERFSFWDVLYEHCLYFTAESLVALFQRCGFRQLGLRSEFDGQMLAIESCAGDDRASPQVRWQASDVRNSIGSFQPEFERVCDRWNERLRRWQRESRRVVLWGAGTKGVMFLNTVDEAAKIEFAVDLNPRKHGRYVSGSGQEIVGPDRLSDVRPDVVLVMNPMYKREIREPVSADQPQCELCSVLDLGRGRDEYASEATCQAHVTKP